MRTVEHRHFPGSTCTLDFVKNIEEVKNFAIINLTNNGRPCGRKERPRSFVIVLMTVVVSAFSSVLYVVFMDHYGGPMKSVVRERSQE